MIKIIIGFLAFVFLIYYALNFLIKREVPRVDLNPGESIAEFSSDITENNKYYLKFIVDHEK